MPDRDEPLLQAITDVIATHPTWGIRLIHGWLCGQGLAVSFSRLRRVYRQSGYAAQWRRRRKKIREVEFPMATIPDAYHNGRFLCSAYYGTRKMVKWYDAP